MDAKTIRESAIVADDGAVHAETLSRKERMPLFDKNGLNACKDAKFSVAQKRQAWNLIRPA